LFGSHARCPGYGTNKHGLIDVSFHKEFLIFLCEVLSEVVVDFGLTILVTDLISMEGSHVFFFRDPEDAIIGSLVTSCSAQRLSPPAVTVMVGSLVALRSPRVANLD